MQETRQAIIALADRLIREKGYNDFSYKDIAVAMDIRNAAIHYYFPTKSDLGVAVIREEIAKIALCKEQCKGLSGITQLKKLVELFSRYGKEGMICLQGSLTSDYPTLPFLMQEKVKEMSRTILDWATVCLEKARQERDLNFHGSAGDRALLVMSSLLSSLLLSRVLGNEVFRRMTDRFLGDMGAA
jgi:TetR/AcrR family transcriptional repressor of nem operon